MGFLADLFSSPKKPKAQDQVATQQQLNQQAQAANIEASKQIQAMNLAAARTDTVGPFGSLTYNQSGTDPSGNPTYTATSALTPDRQAILDFLQGSVGNFAGNIADQYTDLPDFGEGAESLTTNMLNRHLAYVSPYYDQQNNNLDNTLRNQGLLPGTPAYDNALRTLRQTQNESIGQFINTAQPIAFQQAQQQYLTPISVIERLMGTANSIGTGPQLNTPTSNMSAPTTTAPNFIDASNTEYKNALDARNQAWGGIAGIASGILGGAPGTLAGSIGGGLAGLLGLGGTPATGELKKAVA